MAHNPGVREVPYAPQVPLCHLDGNWYEFIQDGHAVWNVNHLIVTRNFGNEVAWVVQIGRYRHSNPEGADIVILFQKLFNLVRKQKKRVISY